MKIFKTLTFAAVAAIAITLLLQLSIARAHAGHPVPFKATFHGFAAPATPTGDPDVFEIVVPLQGTATHLGKFDERLVHYIDFSTLAFAGQAYWTPMETRSPRFSTDSSIRRMIRHCSPSR